MWCSQRSLTLDRDDTDFVTVVRFVHLPAEDGGAAEFLFCGVNEGAVLRIDVTALARAAPPVPVAAGAGANLSAVSASEHAVVVAQHTGTVLALETLDTIVASAGEDGVVTVLGDAAAEHPPVIARLEHKSAVRAVCLWEGRARWAGSAGDAAALYVLTGGDDAFVRVWRLDVTDPGATQLLAVLGPSVADGDGYASLPAVFTVAIDDADGDTERVVAGTSRGWRCWPATSVPDPDNGISDEAHGSTWFTASVWARGGDDIAASIAAATDAVRPTLSDVKAKHRATVCGGREVGTVTDYVEADADRGVTVLFPGLKYKVRWPRACLGRVRYPAAADAPHDGPTYAVVPLRPGRLATAGADGRILILDWAGALGDGGTYRVTFDLALHRDLVKAIVPLRRPDVFVSCSYDGTVREWHVYDEPAAVRCAAVLMVPHGDGAPAAAAPVDAVPLSAGGGDVVTDELALTAFSVSALDVFAAAGVIFTVSLFERTIRSFALSPVATCELPPDFAFNGVRSIKIPDDVAGDIEPSTTEMPSNL
jgi:WD40 repeat protein